MKLNGKNYELKVADKTKNHTLFRTICPEKKRKTIRDIF